jgi:hypothetical protein
LRRPLRIERRAEPYVTAALQAKWAQDILPGYYGHHKADLLITLMDAWVLNPAGLAGMHVAHWLPVDAASSATGISPHLGSMDRRVLEDGGGRPIAMSRFGQARFAAEGIEAFYVPHGIDFSVFRPQDRTALRERHGISESTYIVGVNAANNDAIRKAAPEMMLAFAKFHAAHPDAIAVGMRYLMPQAGNTYQQAMPITDAETGLTVGLRDHYDNNTGTRYVNLECLYGYTVGLTNCGRTIYRSDA